MAVPSWSNLFNGYNVYDDVFTNHPNMYKEASVNGSVVALYDQIVVQAPYDISMVTGIFFSSVVPIVLVAVVLYVFFMPIFKRPQRW